MVPYSLLHGREARLRLKISALRHPLPARPSDPALDKKGDTTDGLAHSSARHRYGVAVQNGFLDFIRCAEGMRRVAATQGHMPKWRLYTLNLA
jgi:hypothetical protein